MKTLIRGGQTSIHSFHMARQLAFTLVKVALIFVVVGELFYIFNKFGFYDFKEVAIFYTAKLIVACGGENYHFHFTGRHGALHDIRALDIVSNITLITQKNQIISAALNGIVHGILYAISIIIALLFLFNYKGKKLAKEEFIRGAKLVSKKRLRKIIQKFNYVELLKNLKNLKFYQNYYRICKIPFPRNAEFLHTIILGSTGTGKTNAIFELLDQIRINGDRAIIYDKMGTYTSTYYDFKKDVILNPLDARSKSWSFFKEIRADSDYDYLASAFIPEKKDSSGPFWTDSARRVFAVFAKKFAEEKEGNPTNQEFVDALLKASYKILAKYLAGTEASSLISAESEKTSLSILAILAAYISSIKYLHDEKENFSIRNWVEAKDENGFLFISSRADQHESLQPLISTWIDIAVKSLLSVEQNQHSSDNPRRIWIILDEIGSLQQLPSLLDGLAQSRQFGGAFVLSLHSISQLKSIYGRDKTDTITSLCRNKLFFAGADDETSDYCSQNLGYQEIEEVKEGISYGASEIRDGVSLNHQKSLKRLVISSEIMFLKALQAYVKFAGSFPIAKVSFEIKNRSKLAERFIDRNSAASKLQEIIVEDKEEKIAPINIAELATKINSLKEDKLSEKDDDEKDVEDPIKNNDEVPSQENKGFSPPPENPSAESQEIQNPKKRRNIF